MFRLRHDFVLVFLNYSWDESSQMLSLNPEQTKIMVKIKFLLFSWIFDTQNIKWNHINQNNPHEKNKTWYDKACIHGSQWCVRSKLWQNNFKLKCLKALWQNVGSDSKPRTRHKPYHRHKTPQAQTTTICINKTIVLLLASILVYNLAAMSILYYWTRNIQNTISHFTLPNKKSHWNLTG